MELDATKKAILELCCEGPYGSWEFWLNIPKTESESNQIIQAITALVKEEKIYPLEYQSIKDGSHKKVVFDAARLKREVKGSMDQYKNVKPDDFYWFVATVSGKEEDQLHRINI